MYPPTTSESLARDSSSESSTGPSCKRCWSPTAIMISSIHATRALVPSRANLLLPRKRFRDSISPEDSVKEDINMDMLEDIKVDATAVEVALDTDVKARINAGIGMEVDVGIDVYDEVEDEVESSDRGTMEVGVNVVVGSGIPDAMLMPDVVEHLEQSSTGPSCKRCWSPTAIMISSIHATRALVPSRVDLLLPRKRFRDSISPEDSVKEDINMDMLEDIKVDATAVEVTVDTDVKARINAGIGMEVDVGIDV
nr:hypothetical protein [Tanacetum cinerariifolium]